MINNHNPNEWQSFHENDSWNFISYICEQVFVSGDGKRNKDLWKLLREVYEWGCVTHFMKQVHFTLQSHIKL